MRSEQRVCNGGQVCLCSSSKPIKTCEVATTPGPDVASGRRELEETQFPFPFTLMVVRSRSGPETSLKAILNEDPKT